VLYRAESLAQVYTPNRWYDVSDSYPLAQVCCWYHAGSPFEDVLGAIGTHESVHASDKAEINKDLKYEQSHPSSLTGRSDREIKPEKLEALHLQQLKEKSNEKKE